MNRILITMMIMMACYSASGQTFGGIRGKNNAGTQGDVKRDADALKVNDSTLKVRIDSLLIYNRADSLVQSNIESYLSSIYSQETTVNPLYFEDIISKNSSKWIGGTATASAMNNLWTNGNVVTKMEIPAAAIAYVSHYKTINVFIRASGTISSAGNIRLQGSTDSSTWDDVALWDVDSLKSDGTAFNLVAPIEKHWAVPVQYPYYRLQTPAITGGGTIQGWALLSQSSWSPSVVGVDSNQFRQTMKISESALPTGAATETTLGSVLTSTQLIDDAVNTTGSAVTAKAIGISGTDGTNARMFAVSSGGLLRIDSNYTRVNQAGGGGGGGTQYAEGATTDPATGTVALGRYDATDLTLTDEQLSAPLLTSRGEVRSMQTNGAVVSDVLTVNGDYVTIPCDGYTSIMFDKLGTFNMTIAAQWSADGVTYTSNSSFYPFVEVRGGNALQTLVSTTQGLYVMPTFGAKSMRLLVTAYTSGTCSITASPTNNHNSTSVWNNSSTSLYVYQSTFATGTSTPLIQEDAASGGGETGTKILEIRTDAPVSNTSTNLDWQIPTATKFGSRLVKNEERHFRTYSASFVVQPAASCTDIFEIKAGAKTAKINKIIITGYQTTGGVMDFRVIKRSTVNTGGTSSTATLVPHLTGDAAASATGTIYTANPTLGTAVGTCQIQYGYIGTTTERGDNIVFDFGEKGKPIYLAASTTQALALNLNSRTVSGGSLAITIEFTEED